MTDAELEAYSREHVYYEVDMFFRTGRELVRLAAMPIEPMQKQFVVNVFLESFTIHMRNLILFLYDGRRKPGDVLAADFLPPNQWQTLRPTMTQTLIEARERAAREIAHVGRLCRESVAGEIVCERARSDRPGLGRAKSPVISCRTAAVLQALQLAFDARPGRKYPGPGRASPAAVQRLRPAR
jgi:hypothetical protein